MGSPRACRRVLSITLMVRFRGFPSARAGGFGVAIVTTRNVPIPLVRVREGCFNGELGSPLPAIPLGACGRVLRLGRLRARAVR